MNRSWMCVIILAVANIAFAQETVSIDGVTYEKVRWGRVTATTVVVYHQAGIATIPLEKLPPELQGRFGYAPKPVAQPLPTAAARIKGSNEVVELLKKHEPAGRSQNNLFDVIKAPECPHGLYPSLREI